MFVDLVRAKSSVDCRFLTGAIKLNHPPNFCVCYDCDPEGIEAAHDMSAQVTSIPICYFYVCPCVRRCKAP
jgi:hypothetical protein